MHTLSCSSFPQCVSKHFIHMLLKQMFHAREHPNSYTLMKFSMYHASSTFGEQMPNITDLRNPLFLNNLLSFSPNEQHRSIIVALRQTAQQAALYCTYVGWDQQAPAQVLIKREAPGFSVPIHAGNILLYRLIIESEPYTIIIVDLQENKQKSRAMPSCYYGNRKGSTMPTHQHTPLVRLQESLRSNQRTVNCSYSGVPLRHGGNVTGAVI